MGIITIIDKGLKRRASLKLQQLLRGEGVAVNETFASIRQRYQQSPLTLFLENKLNCFVVFDVTKQLTDAFIGDVTHYNNRHLAEPVRVRVFVDYFQGQTRIRLED